MRVEVINTGTELLLGDVLNTHLTFIAQQILPLGLRVEHQLAVPDGCAIRAALTDSFSRAGLVFVTGGLGPTTDDITRETAAELLGLSFHHDSEVMRAIVARAAARGFRLTDRIPRQAQVPDGAMVLPNAFGTAPGLYLTANVNPKIASSHLFLLPGPPRELRPMFVEHVLALLRKIVPESSGQASRYYKIAGVGESHVEEAIGEQLLAIDGVELGYCAGAGEVVVRITGGAEALAAAGGIIEKRFAASIFATDSRTLEEVVVQLLNEQGSTLAVAESCTGGLLANRITNVPGSSHVFVAGYVTYSNEAKIDMLGVEPELIAQHGAVSDQVVRAMAEGARKRAGSTYALALTGIAGPDGGTPENPVGTVFVSLAAGKHAPHAIRDRFPSDRVTFKQLATQTGLEMLRRRLRALPR
ncbi:MAG: competence/damage-inducible protein A [Chthoniobacterales bacterium]